MQSISPSEQQVRQFTLAQLYDLSKFRHRHLFDSLQYPWQVLPLIHDYIEKTVAGVEPEQRQLGKVVGKVHIDPDVIVGKGTVIEHGAMIKGPTIIGENCEIRQGAYIRENVIVGDNCLIGHISEIKNTVVMDGAIVPHFNYVGDSVLGNKCHLAAGVKASNTKLDKTNVKVRMGETSVDTGLMKFGVAAGDGCQVGCHATMNPGTVLGRNCLIYPTAMIRGYVPPNSRLKVAPNQTIEKN